jgi:phospholipid/cholesterol/gamma-HCH transport system ATP-binding protein
MITITNLHKTLGVPVLRGVDLEIERGEILAIVGASGTGKSVLLKHIIGLIEPDSGDVCVGGRSVVRASFRELSAIRRGMGYVFQDAALLDSLTVRDNLRLAIDITECRMHPHSVDRRITDALRAVNLDERVLDRLPGELSGGMRKRTGVARALINDPHVILYDEPTTGLDPGNVLAMNALIRSNRERYGATSVVVTHDIATLAALADRVALLHNGRIRFIGTPSEFLRTGDSVVAGYTGRNVAITVTDNEEDAWQATRVVTTY